MLCYACIMGVLLFGRSRAVLYALIICLGGDGDWGIHRNSSAQPSSLHDVSFFCLIYSHSTTVCIMPFGWSVGRSALGVCTFFLGFFFRSMVGIRGILEKLRGDITSALQCTLWIETSPRVREGVIQVSTLFISRVIHSVCIWCLFTSCCSRRVCLTPAQDDKAHAHGENL